MTIAAGFRPVRMPMSKLWGYGTYQKRGSTGKRKEVYYNIIRIESQIIHLTRVWLGPNYHLFGIEETEQGIPVRDRATLWVLWHDYNN